MAAHLLSINQHRPWLLPDKPWIMTQTWNELLFAHWPVSPELLKPFLPANLELDTYNNQAWIGVVPFTMTNIRLRGLPQIPFTSAFHELNVRTYVKFGNKSGVYFFSLDAANRLAVEVARTLFHLPYRYAHMNLEVSAGQSIHYENERHDRRANPAQFLADYRPVSSPYYAEKGTLAQWLTERYCLYTTDSSGHLLRGDIHHEPWLIQDAEAEITINTMITSVGISQPAEQPLLHYSSRLNVLIWGLVDAEL
ncbi:MAG: DUF2071 domain-containing protein [Paenibacillaceae bacterium]